jgi:hypothetical protein
VCLLFSEYLTGIKATGEVLRCNKCLKAESEVMQNEMYLF